MLSPVGRKIRVAKLTPATKKPGQIDVRTPYSVDIQKLTDMDLSADESVKRLFHAMLEREPEGEEVGRLRDFLESSADDRETQLQHLAFTISQLNEPARLGIYRLRGERLTIAVAGKGAKRPSKLDVGKDGGEILYTLERVAAKANTVVNKQLVKKLGQPRITPRGNPQ